MKKIIFYLALPVFLLNFFTALSIPAALASATDISNQQGFGDNGGSAAVSGAFGSAIDIRTIVVNIIVGILGLLGIIFVVLIVYAGFKYMTSMGNEEQTSDAKKQIVSAIIGLVIVLSAYAITSFVTSCLIGATTAHWMTVDMCSQ
jgi:heme/copper-type cytochrome/quinol oxidase subunit 2